MKTLALAGGDLVVGPTGHQVVSGAARIRQDLHLALGERYGNDRFHRGWGSIVVDYVGQVVTPELELLVQSEVNRVLNGYIAVQRDEVLRDNLTNRRSRYDTADVVRSVRSITAQTSLDTIRVKIDLVTSTGESISITKAVSL